MMPIELLMQSIFTSYFSNSWCLNWITEDPNISLNFQTEIPIIVINIYYNQTFETLFHYQGCQGFVLTVQHPVSVFCGLEQEMKFHKDRFNTRKYVILSTKYYQEENAFDIFTSSEIYYVSNVLLIAEETVNEHWDKKIAFWVDSYIYTFWTHRFEGLVGNNDVYMLDKWFSNNQSFLFNNNLFPDKLVNQKGRFLRAALLIYEPYVIVELLGNNSYLYMGSEMITLVSFAEYHNMTLMPLIVKSDYWGEIWENWSGTGLLGHMVEDRAEIGAGALGTWEFAYKFLDLSKPMVRTGITCLVPAPKLISTWLTPGCVLGPYTWLAVLTTFVLFLLVLYILGVLQISFVENIKTSYFGRHNVNLKLKIFGKVLILVSKPFVFQTVTKKEFMSGLLGRYLTGLVFVTTLIISIYYLSALSTILTIPRFEDPIDTIDDLIASGLRWGATQEAWILSIKKSDKPDMVAVVSTFVEASEDELRAFSKTDKFAFAIERLPKKNYAVGPYIKEDIIQNFHLMAGDLYWSQSLMMTRRNSILLPKLDTFILMIFETGLISFWQNEAATKYMNQYIQKAVKYSLSDNIDHGAVKLKLGHIQGIFAIFVLGNVIAFCIFLGELLYHRLVN